MNPQVVYFWNSLKRLLSTKAWIQKNSYQWFHQISWQFKKKKWIKDDSNRPLAILLLSLHSFHLALLTKITILKHQLPFLNWNYIQYHQNINKQTNTDLVTAVMISFHDWIGGLDCHPLATLLTTDHEVKQQYNKGD